MVHIHSMSVSPFAMVADCKRREKQKACTYKPDHRENISDDFSLTWCDLRSDVDKNAAKYRM